MKETSIFPISILEQSADIIINEDSRLSGILYLIVLAGIAFFLVIINFIHIDININAGGIIKPKEDHTVVLTTANGFIEPRNLTLNARVKEGDTLAIIRSEMITAKLPALQNRKKELRAQISDLTQLTSKDPSNVKLSSSLYKQDFLYYLAQWTEAKSKLKQKSVALERATRLYEANVIPLSEFEPIESEHSQAENAISTLTGYQKKQWQTDLVNCHNELREIETQMEQIAIQNAETVIIAPVSGTIQRIQTLYAGSFLPAGQQLAEISPDGHLMAECYVSPKDIGYLRIGTTGKIQVSSFNYTEWGMLGATVEEIFDDVSVSSDGTQSFYKVYCTLSDDHLSLKNGYRGYLKKGMVIHSNFLVTRRTVFQLLYDKINDWLNPNHPQNNE